MNQSIEDTREENNKNSHKRENNLVLSIDQNGKIVRFNSECERITGYNKNEVLNNHFSNYLATEYHSKRWDVIFDSMIKDVSTQDFEFPLITRYGNEVVILWSTLPVVNSGDIVKEIGLIGETLTPEEEIIKFSDDNEKTKRDISKDDKNGNRILFEIGNKKLVFGKNKKTTSKNIRKIKGDRSKKENIQEKNDKKINRRKKVKFEKNKINKNYEKLGEDYKEIKNNLKELEKINKELEKENKKLKIELESGKIRYKDKKQIEEDEITEDINKIKLRNLLKEFFTSIHKTLDGKKRKEEFSKLMDDLDERKNILDSLENKIIEDKKNINFERNELLRLREKLELLEEEVEKRREFLVEQEKKFNESIINTSEKKETKNNKKLDEIIDDKNNNIDVEEVDFNEFLNKSDAAAIVQRGILKQVNNSLADMLGYNIEEIADRSLFDFVDQEGFEGIEKYYRERLKGTDSSSYESIFLTKDNNKIWVNVNIKSSYLHGEKADIMLFKKQDNKINEENKKEEK